MQLADSLQTVLMLTHNTLGLLWTVFHVALLLSVSMYVSMRECMSVSLLLSWGPTEAQQTKFSLFHIYVIKILYSPTVRVPELY